MRERLRSPALVSRRDYWVLVGVVAAVAWALASVLSGVAAAASLGAAAVVVLVASYGRLRDSGTRPTMLYVFLVWSVLVYPAGVVGAALGFDEGKWGGLCVMAFAMVSLLPGIVLAGWLAVLLCRRGRIR